MLLSIIFLCSLLVTVLSIPAIIELAIKKRLFDNPSELRKIHKRIIPNFGGIAIFTAFLFSSALFIPADILPQANIFIASGLILFMVGLKDDMIGLSPTSKFAAQFTSASIISVAANLRITHLYDFMGIDELDYYVSVLLTVIFIVGVVNAYNLIDGIDGLAASLGVMATLFYGSVFFHYGEIGWAYLSISLTGALVGFLFYNLTPAKIFMGDSGSLLLGFVVVVLSLKFVRVADSDVLTVGPITVTSPLALILAVIIIPVFDTLRVFTLRILSGTSPFKADSNHLHHRFLSLGLSHIQTTLVLVIVNSLFIVAAVLLQPLGNWQLISMLLVGMLLMNGLLSIYISKYRKAVLLRAMDDVGRHSMEEFVIKQGTESKN
jgi:UDP-GlcNAc:undecaprenyl-phosphate GlcNAc-1-phosphate transferase